VAAVPDAATKCRAYSLRYRPLLEIGDVTQADRFLELAERLALDLGQPMLVWAVKFGLRVGRALIAGHLREAEHLARDSYEIGRAAGQAEIEWMYATHMFLIRLEQGRLDQEVETLILAAVTSNTALGARLPFLEALLAVVRCELGRKKAAAEVLGRLASVPPPFGIYWLLAAVNWALAATQLHDVRSCQRLYDLLLPYHHYAVPYHVFPTPSVAHHLGLLAVTLRRFRDAKGHFAAAEETHAGIGAAAYLARTRLEWARMLIAEGKSGDTERARELLHQALVTARELQLAKVERDAAALLE
jgi:tetratricopeptide (TPR) repeat protein